MSTLPVEIMEEDEGGTELTMATEEEDEPKLFQRKRDRLRKKLRKLAMERRKTNRSAFKESEIVSTRNSRNCRPRAKITLTDIR
jgi:hypothetical protein